MLDFLRKNIKRFAIFLWIATIAFIIGGAYLFVSGPFRMGSNTAIEVGDIKISFPEYEQAYQNMYKFYVQLLTQLKGGNITEQDIKNLNIKQKTINMLINRALLLEEAKKEGVRVTKEDVIRAIQSNPAFFVDGKFSKEKYLALLKINGINPKDYEEGIKTSLYIEKLKQKLFRNVKVTDKEVRNFFANNYSKVDLKFVVINYKAFEKKVKVTNKELEKYYSLNREKYRVPTKVKFRYIVVPLSYVEKEIKISDNQTRNFYETHKESFMVPMRIRVAHILFAKKDNETESQLKQEAERVYKLLKEGKLTFKEAVKKYSADEYTRNVGGDLGYITKDMVVKSFWNAVVKLKKGEISKPFKTEFGYHIALVEDIKKPYLKPFNEVKQEIEKYLKEKKAKKIWFIVADKIFVKARDSKKPLKEIAAKYGLPFKESPFMSLNNPHPPFTSKMIENALLSEVGKLLGPDLSAEGYLIYKVVQKKNSYIPSLKEIRDKVEKDYIKSEAESMAREEAKKVLSEIREGKILLKIAKEYDLEIHTVSNLTKLTPMEKFPCSFKQNVIEEIFSHGAGYSNICSFKGDEYVFEVTKKIFDKTEFEKMKKSIEQQLLMQKENEIINRLLSKLRKEVKIKINPKLQ